MHSFEVKPNQTMQDTKLNALQNGNQNFVIFIYAIKNQNFDLYKNIWL